jgi:hypothetical protein
MSVINYYSWICIFYILCILHNTFVRCEISNHNFSCKHFHFQVCLQNCENRPLAVCVSVRPSVHMERLGSHWMDFREILCLCIFQKSLEKIQVWLKSVRITGTSHEDLCTFMIMSPDFFLEWEMFQTKVVEKIKTHILCSITFFRKSCHLWGNVEKFYRARQATDDNVTQCVCFACWITKATHTHSEYVILIAEGNNCYWNVPHCYLICTLPVLYIFVICWWWLLWLAATCSSFICNTKLCVDWVYLQFLLYCEQNRALSP